MRARLAAALPALVLALAGCGGDDGERREAYERYVESASEAHTALRPGFVSGQEALRDFAEGRATAETADSLREAAATLAAVRASLAVVEPPEEAEPLHDDLLRLLDLQADAALELALAAEYVPDAEVALREPAAAAETLRKALRASEGGPAQAAALRRYVRELAASLEEFDRLAPPPVLVSWHEAQLEQIGVSRRLAAQLAAAIDANDRARIERVLDRYAEALPDARGVALAQRRAVRAFNARLEDQQELQERIVRRESEIVLELVDS